MADLVLSAVLLLAKAGFELARKALADMPEPLQERLAEAGLDSAEERVRQILENNDTNIFAAARALKVELTPLLRGVQEYLNRIESERYDARDDNDNGGGKREEEDGADDRDPADECAEDQALKQSVQKLADVAAAVNETIIKLTASLRRVQRVEEVSAAKDEEANDTARARVMRRAKKGVSRALSSAGVRATKLSGLTNQASEYIVKLHTLGKRLRELSASFESKEIYATSAKLSQFLEAHERGNVSVVDPREMEIIPEQALALAHDEAFAGVLNAIRERMHEVDHLETQRTFQTHVVNAMEATEQCINLCESRHKRFEQLKEEIPTNAQNLREAVQNLLDVLVKACRRDASTPLAGDIQGFVDEMDARRCQLYADVEELQNFDSCSVPGLDIVQGIHEQYRQTLQAIGMGSDEAPDDGRNTPCASASSATQRPVRESCPELDTASVRALDEMEVWDYAAAMQAVGNSPTGLYGTVSNMGLLGCADAFYEWATRSVQWAVSHLQWQGCTSSLADVIEALRQLNGDEHIETWIQAVAQRRLDDNGQAIDDLGVVHYVNVDNVARALNVTLVQLRRISRRARDEDMSYLLYLQTQQTELFDGLHACLQHSKAPVYQRLVSLDKVREQLDNTTDRRRPKFVPRRPPTMGAPSPEPSSQHS